MDNETFRHLVCPVDDAEFFGWCDTKGQTFVFDKATMNRTPRAIPLLASTRHQAYFCINTLVRNNIKCWDDLPVDIQLRLDPERMEILMRKSVEAEKQSFEDMFPGLPTRDIEDTPVLDGHLNRLTQIFCALRVIENNYVPDNTVLQRARKVLSSIEGDT